MVKAIKYLFAWMRYHHRERWEYETFNSTDMREWQRFGAAGWEIVQIGWGKSMYNILAKRRIRWF